MQRQALQNYLAEYLKVDEYKDFAPNGLQVEGREEVKKIITGVTACQALLDIAVAKNADAIMVHHGYFWKSEPTEIVGFKKQRIATLLKNDINLFGYHLPLDDHNELGNNALLGKLWGIGSYQKQGLVCCGDLPEAIDIEQFVEQVSVSLSRKALWLPGGKKSVKTIAWCSGGAQGYMDKAAKMGADVFISGEVSEYNQHLAQEMGMHYVSAGHHATETHGIKALGEHLAEKFALDVEFIDIPNPV